MAKANSSSSTRTTAWGPADEKRHSPIPYRIGPLDYEPAVMCNCGVKAALWISWSDENPGRRYYKCFRARESDGCDFHGWYEGRHDPFVCSLLVDLRNAVWGLKRALKDDVAEATARIEELEKENAELEKHREELVKEREEYKKELGRLHDAECELRLLVKEKWMLRTVCFALFAVVVRVLVSTI